MIKNATVVQLVENMKEEECRLTKFHLISKDFNTFRNIYMEARFRH